MATVTNEIIKNQYGIESSFNLMTTPLYTGDYMDSGSYAPILLALFPIILTLWANLGSVVSEASKEENEEKL